jgi:hypothetical protein
VHNWVYHFTFSLLLSHRFIANVAFGFIHVKLYLLLFRHMLLLFHRQYWSSSGLTLGSQLRPPGGFLTFMIVRLHLPFKYQSGECARRLDYVKVGGPRSFFFTPTRGRPSHGSNRNVAVGKHMPILSLSILMLWLNVSYTVTLT